MVEWGAKVAESKELLERLGIADRAIWIPPQPSRSMLRYVDACDLLVDQFWIGAFGTTMPKGMPLAKPAMSYVDPALHSWCLPELPNIINVRTPEEVFEGLKRAYRDRAWLKQIGEEGRDWYMRYHSNVVILASLSQIYDRLITGRVGRRAT